MVLRYTANINYSTHRIHENQSLPSNRRKMTVIFTYTKLSSTNLRLQVRKPSLHHSVSQWTLRKLRTKQVRFD